MGCPLQTVFFARGAAAFFAVPGNQQKVKPAFLKTTTIVTYSCAKVKPWRKKLVKKRRLSKKQGREPGSPLQLVFGCAYALSEGGDGIPPTPCFHCHCFMGICKFAAIFHHSKSGVVFPLRFCYTFFEWISGLSVIL